MAVGEQNVDELLVATRGRHAFVCVRGRGTVQNAAALKAFTALMVERGVRDFVFDLDRCDYLDSTFLGVLLGLARRLRERDEGVVCVINPSPENRSLLHTLGLDLVVELREPSAVLGWLGEEGGEGAGLEALAVDDSDRRVTLETMLGAHRDLAGLSPENAIEFEEVIRFLEQAAGEEAGDG